MPHRTGVPTPTSASADARAPLRRLALVVLVLAALPPLAPVALRAQPPQGAAPRLTPAIRTQVIDSLGARLSRRYVDADTARRIADLLRTRLRAGAYDSIATAARFAEVVTRDLRAINGDLHLSLAWDPRAAAGAREEEAHEPPRRSGPADSTPPRVPPPSGQPADPFTLDVQRHNYGYSKLEILPMNVGYLAIDQFMGAEGVDQVVAEALRFLRHTDAIIIDVRRNPGGASVVSHYLASHFLGAKSVPTIRSVDRGAGDTTIHRSFEEVAGPRRTDVPLYVLTSQGTGSAAEEFAFILKNQGRATIVGDRTAGAGHMVRGFDVGHGFVAGISHARVTDVRSGLEWERVGVQPDVRVAPELARETAYAHALRALAARSGDAGRKAILARRAETLDAQVAALASGARPDAGRLAAFAGTYDDRRVVRVSDGKLWYHTRPNVMPTELVPLGGDRFALDGASWVTFETAGAGARMHVERADGTRATYLRTAPAATSAASAASSARR